LLQSKSNSEENNRIQDCVLTGRKTRKRILTNDICRKTTKEGKREKGQSETNEKGKNKKKG
jgi:hypothetical protein